MLKRILILSILLALPVGAPAGDFWYLFERPGQLYYDRNGCFLDSTKGRKNIQGIDEFYGTGSPYPDLSAYEVLDRHERANLLLVRLRMGPSDPPAPESLEIPATTLSSFVVRTGPTGARVRERKEVLFALSAFRPVYLNDTEAAAILKAWGVPGARETETGVTN